MSAEKVTAGGEVETKSCAEGGPWAHDEKIIK